jgi:hypothetical protein
MDIPKSYATKVVKYISGSRNLASSYIRPASYAGPLGPVYAGVTEVADVNSSPWNQTKSPVDPSNIQVRDIKIDANDNIWIILQIGWEYCRPCLATQAAWFYGQEYTTWVGYETTYSPDTLNLYDPNHFLRQYNPSGNYFRAGPIRPRIFIVCFDKQTNYKTWDYVPFRPGTLGFNKLQRESNARGPAIYGITVPPSKLDSDPYGNIYYSVGTADIWEQTYGSYSLHCLGIAKNEIGYLYVRPSTEKAYTVTSGIDVGRIGPYPSQCTFMAYDQNTVSYYNHEIGRTDRPAFRNPLTWTIGGDRVAITKWKYQSGIETWYASTFGNATGFRCTFLINPAATFPHPYVNSPEYWGPCFIRSVENEWGSSYRYRDIDLLFAACDYLTRNYSYLSSPTTYVCENWWKNEVPWSSAITSYAQLHPQKDVWFEIGAGDTEPYTGWKPSESPGFWYTHFNIVNYTLTEMGCRGYAITDTRGVMEKGFLPLVGAISYSQDTIFKVASTPYSQSGIGAGTDFYERHGLGGMLPTCKSRVECQDMLILPIYDWKHEIFSFTGHTWDTYNAIRSKFGTYTTSVTWPWRWHSMKRCIEQASWDDPDPLAYGAKASYLDPASRVIPGEYQPLAADKVFYYDDTFIAMMADAYSKLDRPEVVSALTGIFHQLAIAKWHYFETGLTNLNYGAFSSAINCENSVGVFVPRYKISG